MIEDFPISATINQSFINNQKMFPHWLILVDGGWVNTPQYKKRWLFNINKCKQYVFHCMFLNVSLYKEVNNDRRFPNSSQYESFAHQQSESVSTLIWWPKYRLRVWVSIANGYRNHEMRKEIHQMVLAVSYSI